MDFKSLSRRLADNAEAVCAHYLSNGKRHGRYWLVGDVFNTPGRSLYVRLYSSSTGKPAGKWADAANPDHYGDLLDLIRYNQNISSAAELPRSLALPVASLKTRSCITCPMQQCVGGIAPVPGVCPHPWDTWGALSPQAKHHRFIGPEVAALPSRMLL